MFVSFASLPKTPMPLLFENFPVKVRYKNGIEHTKMPKLEHPALINRWPSSCIYRVLHGLTCFVVQVLSDTNCFHHGPIFTSTKLSRWKHNLKREYTIVKKVGYFHKHTEAQWRRFECMVYKQRYQKR